MQDKTDVPIISPKPVFGRKYFLLKIALHTLGFDFIIGL